MMTYLKTSFPICDRYLNFLIFVEVNPDAPHIDDPSKNEGQQNAETSSLNQEVQQLSFLKVNADDVDQAIIKELSNQGSIQDLINEKVDVILVDDQTTHETISDGDGAPKKRMMNTDEGTNEQTRGIVVSAASLLKEEKPPAAKKACLNENGSTPFNLMQEMLRGETDLKLPPGILQ